MPNIAFPYFPGGVCKVITMSYDDGTVEDRRLVEIFNTHGLKGSFHLNSSRFDNSERHLTSAEIPDLFAGHEISVHSVNHPFLHQLPREQVIHEILEDRRALEALAGYPVRGMSYPFGTCAYNNATLDILRNVGIVCSRTTDSTKGFEMPEDFLQWHPTIHHNNDLLEVGKRFQEMEIRWPRMQMLYVWGHSFEFPPNDNWNIMEDFAAMVGGDKQFWFATNIEIVDYMTALQTLQFSVDRSIVHNPTALNVWIAVDGNPVEVPAGAQLKL